MLAGLARRFNTWVASMVLVSFFTFIAPNHGIEVLYIFNPTVNIWMCIFYLS